MLLQAAKGICKDFIDVPENILTLEKDINSLKHQGRYFPVKLVEDSDLKILLDFALVLYKHCVALEIQKG